MADTTRRRASPRYQPPFTSFRRTLEELLVIGRRTSAPDGDRDLFATASAPDGARNISINCVGDVSLLSLKCVAIVGTRKVSDNGAKRARKLARELVESGVVVVSGLAAGVDKCAHESALESGGRTIGVIGTPIDKAYPIENAHLQETIYREHLLLSQFDIGERVFPANFPRRNKVMAALSDASVIIEASDTSGTLHQAVECARLGRWLFIAQSVVDDASLTWPRKFLDYARARVLTSTNDLLEALG